MCGVAVRAFLWEDGEMVDLNSLIPPGVPETGFALGPSISVPKPMP
jgi:hypothetical protein